MVHVKVVVKKIVQCKYKLFLIEISMFSILEQTLKYI